MKDYKKILEGVVNIINNTYKSDIGFDNICAYIGENCPELKESEDDRMVKFIKNQLFNIKKTITENYELDAKLTKAICWLEKQCEQKIKTPDESLGIDYDTYNKIVDECIYGEQKPACSYEDEAMWVEISDLLWEGYKQSGSKFSWDDIRNWVIHKLKSIRPQKQWKPSDEQMEALKDALNDAIWQYDYKGSMIKEEVTRKHAEIIESLYNDLKKIKGE